MGLQPNPNPKTCNVLVALCDKKVFLSLPRFLYRRLIPRLISEFSDYPF